LNQKLADLAGGTDRVQVDADTVQDAVIALARLHRSIGARIFNCEGALRSVVGVEVNGQAVPVDRAGAISLADGDTVWLAFP
jgi:hypothetical protein